MKINHRNAKAFLCLLTLSVCTCQTLSAQTRLRVNHLERPLGVDDAKPRLSWQLVDEKKPTPIVVTDESGRAVWQHTSPAGEVMAVYDGEPLLPFTTYRVRIGEAETSFETGMIDQSLWQGAWICDGIDRERRPAPYFRKKFSITKAIKSARAYIACGGLFELTVNGKPASTGFLEPVYTRYDRRTMYMTFDVTSLLAEGDNVLGVVLGNGWYNYQPKAPWNFDQAPWRQRPKFCMDLRITFADGSTQVVPTDLSWRTAEGALVYNNIYVGEHIDFRKQTEWTSPSFDDKDWRRVSLTGCPAPLIASQQMTPIRKAERLTAVKLTSWGDTTFVYDFGKNMAGITELCITGERDTEVRIVHGERLTDDGHVDMSNVNKFYGGDRQQEPFGTDIFWLSGERDNYACRFSYKGFRYAEVVTSKPLSLTKENLIAWRTNTDMESAGSIKSSNKLLEDIMSATRAAYLSNFVGYPTDCPHREKNGWTGDAHLAVEMALYNFDAITAYEQWLCDHRDEQQPNGMLPNIIPTSGWGYDFLIGIDWVSTTAIIPWQLYLFYGDLRPLSDNYEAIRRLVDYVERGSDGHITSWGLGDWIPVKAKSDRDFCATVYFYADALILSKAAGLLGKADDARRYSQLATDIRKAINDKYFDAEKHIYAGGTQTEMSMALYWGIVADEHRQEVARRLADDVVSKDYHLDVGVHGCKALLCALSENGYADVAYRVAVQDTYPSWGAWIVSKGATTLRENWKLDNNDSDNHIMYGEIGAWPYKGLGGIYPDPAQPGFRHIILRPNFVEGLEHFEARHNSPYGEISSSWTRKGRRVNYDIVVPQGSTATWTAPDGQTHHLQAGAHHFKLKL